MTRIAMTLSAVTADAARVQRDGLRVDIAYQTAEAYLTALQAHTLSGVAASTLQQFAADLQHAQLLLPAGTLQRVDVLRLEVERAGLEQQICRSVRPDLAARGPPPARAAARPARRHRARAGRHLYRAARAAVDRGRGVARARRDRAAARVAEANRHAAELGW